MITRDELTDRIRSAVKVAGSQRQLAIQWGINASYVTDLLRGLRDPGPKVLEAMGYDRVVLYREREGE